MRSSIFLMPFTTVTQSLFDFIRHAVVHFAPFLAPFCVFKILIFVDFFPCKKTDGEAWKRNMKTLLEIFAQCYRLCMVKVVSQQDPNILNHQEIMYVRTFTFFF